jgi:hypothetical protein
MKGSYNRNLYLREEISTILMTGIIKCRRDGWNFFQTVDVFLRQVIVVGWLLCKIVIIV